MGVEQLAGIVDAANGGNGEQPQLRTDQQGLRLGVGDAADAGVAPEFRQIIFKFCTEGSVLDVVDLAFKALFAQHRHTAGLGAQVGMIVHAEEHIHGYIAPGNGAKKTAHSGFSSLEKHRRGGPLALPAMQSIAMSARTFCGNRPIGRWHPADAREDQ